MTLYLLKSSRFRQYHQENLALLRAPAGSRAVVRYASRWVEPALLGDRPAATLDVDAFSRRPSMEDVMDKEHFEVMLEKIAGDLGLVLEIVTGNRERLDRHDERLDKLDGDVNEMKGSLGILVPIANNHELRLQGVESTLRDHLKDHF